MLDLVHLIVLLSKNNFELFLVCAGCSTVSTHRNSYLETECGTNMLFRNRAFE